MQFFFKLAAFLFYYFSSNIYFLYDSKVFSTKFYPLNPGFESGHLLSSAAAAAASQPPFLRFHGPLPYLTSFFNGPLPYLTSFDGPEKKRGIGGIRTSDLPRRNPMRYLQTTAPHLPEIMLK